VSAPQAQERRIVSILFADLVGFTERSDLADPEDVRRTLVPFHAAAKGEIERFGGTLDKFIGDAVMGVFGAPIAHEDDPERAVRAALSIARTIGDLRSVDRQLAVRIAVHTGEALVNLVGGTQVGEAVAGDVVNTASRMQSVAAPGSVVIGDTTRQALSGRFDLEVLPEAKVKGKADPLHLWRVAGERSEGEPAAPAALVDRHVELARLLDAQRVTGTQRIARTLVIVAEPGMGKSRLLDELRDRADGATRWRMGWCPPYGEAVTFAPLAEVLRGEAAIDRTASPSEVRRGLEALAVASGREPGWMRRCLAPILGLDEAGSDVIEPAEMAQAVAAALTARPEPLGLILEDLHWAQPRLLEVVVELLEALESRPALTVITARPELVERDQGWRERGESLLLPPLSAEETDELVGSVLAGADTGFDRPALLQRAGGNPLFAVEFARMVGERGAGDGGAEVPSTVRAVIAARLDRLPADLRTLLQDAAVVGLEFWPGAVAAIRGTSERDVEGALDRLVRRGLADPPGSSAFHGQAAFAFSHALVQEVAYSQLPRARRAEAHLEVARWIERAGGERAAELAETIAHHAVRGLELSVAAGLDEVTPAAREMTLRWSLAAADRLSRIDANPAFERYRLALELAGPGTSELASALAGSAFTGRRTGRLEAREVLRRHEQAVAIRRTLDDQRALGRSLIALGSQLAATGETARSRDVLADAVRVLEQQPPGVDLGRAYAYLAEDAMFAGRVEPALEGAERALELVGDEALDVRTMALHIRGDSRCSSGDRGGLEDLEEAIEISRRSGSVADEVTSETYLAEWLWAYRSPSLGTEHYDRAIQLGERHGVVSQHLWSIAGSAGPLFDGGDWDLALSRCDELLAVEAGLLDPALRAAALVMRARVLVLRGRRDEVSDAAEILELAEPLGELQVLAPALMVAAQLALADHEPQRSVGHLKRFAETTRQVAETYRESLLGQVARIGIAVGEADLVADLVAISGGRTPREDLNVRGAAATVAEARREFDVAEHGHADVAEGWRSYGNPFELAMSLLGRARCADQLGRAEATVGHEAREILRSLGVPA
jgi:class 3 adenylate cyclase/tetratricopeptide (TPR) repeat protein